MAYLCIGTDTSRGTYWTYIEVADKIKDKKEKKPFLSDRDVEKIKHTRRFNKEADAKSYCDEENEKILPK